jgi:hypothetical protein
VIAFDKANGFVIVPATAGAVIVAEPLVRPLRVRVPAPVLVEVTVPLKLAEVPLRVPVNVPPANGRSRVAEFATQDAQVPVRLVITPEAGVPSAGVTRVGDVAKTGEPVPVAAVLNVSATALVVVGTSIRK